MKLSIARTSAGGPPRRPMNRGDVGFDVRGTVWRRMALVLSAILVLGCIGIAFGSSKPAGASTVFAPGQVSPLSEGPRSTSTTRRRATS